MRNWTFCYVCILDLLCCLFWLLLCPFLPCKACIYSMNRPERKTWRRQKSNCHRNKQKIHCFPKSGKTELLLCGPNRSKNTSLLGHISIFFQVFLHCKNLEKGLKQILRIKHTTSEAKNGKQSPICGPIRVLPGFLILLLRMSYHHAKLKKKILKGKLMQI